MISFKFVHACMGTPEHVITFMGLFFCKYYLSFHSFYVQTSSFSFLIYFYFR